MNFSVIVAMDENRGIGLEGKLPWHLSADLKYFKKVTTTTQDPAKKNAVIMGRVTWESIPKKFRPLPDRLNIVLSRNADYMIEEGIEMARSFMEALEICEQEGVERVFVIGGAQIFEMALEDPHCEKVYITELLQSFNCDTFLSPINKNRFDRAKESEILSENEISFRFVVYESQKNH